jgi:hypothetical protein
VWYKDNEYGVIVLDNDTGVLSVVVGERMRPAGTQVAESARAGSRKHAPSLKNPNSEVKR